MFYPRFAIGVTVVLLAGGGISYLVQSAKHDTEEGTKNAIASVLKQRQEAIKGAKHIVTFRGPHAHTVTNFSAVKYLAGIHHIKSADCPLRFRVAWLDYVQTCEREFGHGAFNGVNDFAAMGEYVLGAHAMSANVTKDALARLDKLDVPEANRRLEMAAMQFGVGR